MSGGGKNSSQRTASRKGKRPVQKTQKGPIAVAITAATLVAIVAAFIIVKVNSGSSTPTSSSKPVPAAVLSALSNVSPSALAQAGYSNSIPLTQKIAASAPLLMNAGKPEILYIGADYCPFCAAERWPLIAALSKFGTFHGLHLMTSSATDAYPNTPTFSFYKSGYTSQYLTFTPVEWATNQPTSSSQNFSGYSLLQVPTKAQQKLFTTFDNVPYVSSANAGSIPFIDFANRYLQVGASYSPQVLSGLSWDTVAGSLSLPTSATGQAIDQTTNVLIASICKITNGHPGSVCGTATIKSVSNQLGG